MKKICIAALALAAMTSGAGAGPPPLAPADLDRVTAAGMATPGQAVGVFRFGLEFPRDLKLSDWVKLGQELRTPKGLPLPRNLARLLEKVRVVKGFGTVVSHARGESGAVAVAVARGGSATAVATATSVRRTNQ